MKSSIAQPIQMVDLKSQYQRLKTEIDAAVLECISSAQYIRGPQVGEFENNLGAYLDCKHVISCANGTDALQIAFMALDLKPGDEVIVPSFTYVATAEAAALLGIVPVLADVVADTFCLDAASVAKLITAKTKAIVPVHLFGQASRLDEIMDLAAEHGLFVIEDNAQALGSDFEMSAGVRPKTGTIGTIGTTSFFPSKNLGCFGDGGAMFTLDDELADRLRMIANHGQAKKYYHSMIGVNSRLDTLQAAILDVKLRHLDEFRDARRAVADRYDEAFADVATITTPVRDPRSMHVFHQYTLTVNDGRRDDLIKFLTDKGIPSMVYYPVPLSKQEAFAPFARNAEIPVTEQLCESVVSLPIHTEMDSDTQSYIIESVLEFSRS